MSILGSARDHARVSKLARALAAQGRRARWALTRKINAIGLSPVVVVETETGNGRSRQTRGIGVTGTSIPLANFCVQYGAELIDGGRLIRSNGSHNGIVVFGPRLLAPSGLYIFTVDIKTTARRLPDIMIEIWSDHGVLATQKVTTHARQVRIPTVVTFEQRLEVRVHSRHDPFEISDIRYENFSFDDVARFAAVAEDRNDTLRKVLASLGLSEEVLTEAEREAWTSPEAVDISLFGGNHVTGLSLKRIYEQEPMLRAAGLSPSLILQLFERNNSHVAVDSGLVEGELVQGFPKMSNAFQQEIVRKGAMRIVSPFSGDWVETSNGLPISSPNGAIISLAYEFAGPCPMVIGASTGWTGTISFLWFIKQELIIFHDVADSDWTNAQEVICAHISQCARHYPDVQAYRKADKTVALATGFISNMGHYFWNESSGLERMVRLTGLEKVDTVYARAGAWLDMTEIFAQDIPCKTQLVHHGDELFALALRNRHIVVRPIGGQYDDALADKVRRTVSRLLDNSPPPANPALEALNGQTPYVLFVNLRAHNKSWIEQVEGISRIAEMLGAARSEPVVVYLDGYVDCAEVAQAIAANTIPNVTFVDGTRVSFLETLDWAFRTDFFIAVIGSGLVPLTWIANKPGIAYGDTRHLDQMEWWGQVRTDAAEITWPTAEHVKDTEDLFYANYSIKPKLMMSMFAKRVLN